jgi:hypothetical protein
MSERQWGRVGPRPRIGPIQFDVDGGFSLIGTGAAFAKNNRLTNCQVGHGARFDFDDGKARLEDARAVHHLRFIGKEGWEYAVVRKVAAVEARAGGGRWLFGVAVLTTVLVVWWILH